MTDSTGMQLTQVDSAFRRDVIRGLSASPKFLLSKYFYDSRGDALFQQIMRCPEYYLTRAEEEILRDKSRDILRACTTPHPTFDIVELGAGDASKTTHLLRAAIDLTFSNRYVPIDISASMVEQLTQTLPVQLPGLEVDGLAGEYFPMLAQLQHNGPTPKLVLFLGGTIGNLLPTEAIAFCKELNNYLKPGDYVLMGFDLRKDPQTILNAYNDKAGLTRAFNLNLLNRINDELGGTFDPANFVHFPVYDPVTGACKSYLVSTCQHDILLDDGTLFRFGKDEPIYMEISQKYTHTQIAKLGNEAGFEPIQTYMDSQQQFTDVLWRKP